MEGANMVKLHRFSGKVSYLFYPDFDDVAHPSLARSLKVSLRTLQLDCYDYAATSNRRSCTARSPFCRVITLATTCSRN